MCVDLFDECSRICLAKDPSNVLFSDVMSQGTSSKTCRAVDAQNTCLTVLNEVQGVVLMFNDFQEYRLSDSDG